MQGSPPTQTPLALYSGIVTVGADGTAEVEFDIPAFTGTVRVMAVAWSKDKVGHGDGDVIVRDPVVVTATLPRFLLTGDKSTLRLDLDNVEGETGNYEIAVSTDGPLQRRKRRQDHHARRQEAWRGALPVEATGVGAGTVRVAVTGPERLCARAALRADGEALDANPGAPHGEAARARPKHHAARRRVRRSRARHRQASRCR